MMAGDRCLGERHDDVIGNQREAITKLKEELNIALLASPPGNKTLLLTKDNVLSKP